MWVTGCSIHKWSVNGQYEMVLMANALNSLTVFYFLFLKMIQSKFVSLYYLQHFFPSLFIQQEYSAQEEIFSKNELMK